MACVEKDGIFDETIFSRLDERNLHVLAVRVDADVVSLVGGYVAHVFAATPQMEIIGARRRVGDDMCKAVVTLLFVDIDSNGFHKKARKKNVFPIFCKDNENREHIKMNCSFFCRVLFF